MRKKCLIWGSGEDYQKLYNLIKYEELKGNISIVAIVSKDFDGRMYDGYRVISLAEISTNIEFDYIIVASSKYYYDILIDAEKLLGNIREKIVDGKVMNIPGFDFGDYIKLRENPVSIITNDCFGGILYHYLNLEFSSPFINCWIGADDFLQLVNDLREYMKQPLLLKYEGDMYQCPVGTLTYLQNEICIHFNHSYSFDEAKRDFERRRNRINWDNIFICSNFSNRAYTENFAKLPYRKKNITAEDFGIEGSIALLGYEYEYNDRQKDVSQTREFWNYMHNMNNFTKEIDIFRMLLGKNEIKRNYYSK